MIDLQNHMIDLLKAVRDGGLDDQVYAAREALTYVYNVGFEAGQRAERQDRFVINHLTATAPKEPE